MSKRIKKRFDIAVTAANGTFSQTFDLDKTIIGVYGILFTSDREDLLYYRGSQRIEINRDEVFPESYETRLLMSGINVSPNDRYYNLGGIPPGNGKVKVDYKDMDTSLAAFAAYRVSLYLDCETIDL
ncbi:MAG TPA: hypothetical protein VF939_08955 [Puia sp.]